jgi:Uma2 family endonuclease
VRIINIHAAKTHLSRLVEEVGHVAEHGMDGTEGASCADLPGSTASPRTSTRPCRTQCGTRLKGADRRTTVAARARGVEVHSVLQGYMRAHAPIAMTAEAFLAWAEERPDRQRYELVAGEVVAMAPERVAHNQAKAAAWAALRDGIRANGLPCQAMTDGMMLRVDEQTVLVPDAMVRCGERLDARTTVVTDPVIVVEVVSPTSLEQDTHAKVRRYFALPTVRHYLVLDPEGRTAFHYRRDDAGRIGSAVVTAGTLDLDPPGLRIEVTALFDAG